MPTETAHEINCRDVKPGTTIESFGVSPEDILDTESASYSREDGYGRVQTEKLLRVWYIAEVEVEVSDCSKCNSEKVYSKSREYYACPHCDLP